MAMSVADNPVIERAPRRPQQTLALESFVGAVLLLAGLWTIFAGIPALWTEILRVPSAVNEFLSDALLIVVDLGVAIGLGYLAYLFLRKESQKGIRAGIVMAAAEIFLVLQVGIWLGRLLQNQDLGVGLGAGVTVIVSAALLAGVVYLFMTPGWARFLEGFEHQGWFSGLAYKGNQGVRIRRATVLGALVLGFSGVITMVSHRSFGSDRLGPNDWYWPLPFTASRPVKVDDLLEKLAAGDRLGDDERRLVEDLGATPENASTVLQPLAGTTYAFSRYVPLMYKLHVMLPVVMSVLILFFSWRLVNVPTFADFLIATEAEMNKVSWTTRRRLFQDTIVVLVTTFLMTAFLFFIDILWIKVLSNSWIHVLQVDVKAQLQKQQEKSQW